jgi:hypothetical protein
MMNRKSFLRVFIEDFETDGELQRETFILVLTVLVLVFTCGFMVGQAVTY